MDCDCPKCRSALIQIMADSECGKGSCGCSDCQAAYSQLAKCTEMLPATPPPRRGRPATGINTKVIRVPLDFDRETALKMYYEWLPIIREYKEIAELFPLPVRNHKLVQMFEEIGDVPQLM